MAKFLQNNETARGVQEVQTGAAGGAADANKIPNLDANGKLTQAMMPDGVGPDSVTLEASEAIAAGRFVNFFNDAGTQKMRLADGPSGKPADAFVLTAVASGANGEALKEGANGAVTGLTPGDQWLGTNGATVATKPTTAGQIAQYLGHATAATSICTEIDEPVTLA